MQIGVFGTGMVGEAIATKLVELGHQVKMGARSATNEKAAAWVGKAGGGASQGTFAEAAAHGEVLFNCTRGDVALDAISAAGAANLSGKVLVDVSNPLDFSKGMPPGLLYSSFDSLGERIQAAFPGTKVVKALSTVNCDVMVNPALVGDDHTMFMSGDDADAKGRVRQILTEWFGWNDVIDLGDITTARGMEGLLPLWLRLWGALGTGHFNVKVVRPGS